MNKWICPYDKNLHTLCDNSQNIVADRRAHWMWKLISSITEIYDSTQKNIKNINHLHFHLFTRAGGKNAVADGSAYWQRVSGLCCQMSDGKGTWYRFCYQKKLHSYKVTQNCCDPKSLSKSCYHLFFWTPCWNSTQYGHNIDSGNTKKSRYCFWFVGGSLFFRGKGLHFPLFVFPLGRPPILPTW